MNAIKAVEKFAAENKCDLIINSDLVQLTAPVGSRFWAASEATPHVLRVKGAGGAESLAASVYELANYGLEPCTCLMCRIDRANKAERN